MILSPGEGDGGGRAVPHADPALDTVVVEAYVTSPCHLETAVGNDAPEPARNPFFGYQSLGEAKGAQPAYVCYMALRPVTGIGDQTKVLHLRLPGLGPETGIIARGDGPVPILLQSIAEKSAQLLDERLPLDPGMEPFERDRAEIRGIVPPHMFRKREKKADHRHSALQPLRWFHKMRPHGVLPPQIRKQRVVRRAEGEQGRVVNPHPGNLRGERNRVVDEIARMVLEETGHSGYQALVVHISTPSYQQV